MRATVAAGLFDPGAESRQWVMHAGDSSGSDRLRALVVRTNISAARGSHARRVGRPSH